MAAPRNSPRRTRRWLIWLLVCGACLFLLLLPVVKFVMPWWRGRRYAARRAEEEAAWWRSRWPEVPDARNRFFAYQDVLERVERARQDLGYRRWWKGRLTRMPELGDSWPEYDAPIREAVAAWSGVLDALEAATELPEYRLPTTYIGSGEEHSVFREVRVARNSFGLFNPQMKLSRMLAFRAWIDIRDGNRQAGSKRLVALSCYAADTGEGGTVLPYVAGLAMLGNVSMVVCDALNLRGWRAAELRALGDVLRSELARLSGLPNAMRTEQMGKLILVARGETIFVPARSIFRPSVHLFEALAIRRYDVFMEKVIAALSLPQREWKARAESLTVELGDADTDDPRNCLLLTLPSLLGARTACDRCSANVSVATAALRMRAVFLEGGAYPQSMEALSKADGRPIVRDPFSGAPLRVTIREDGSAIIYHIGRNEVDEGGRDKNIERLRKDPPREPEPGTDDAGPVGVSGYYSPDDFGIELQGRSPGAEKEAE